MKIRSGFVSNSSSSSFCILGVINKSKKYLIHGLRQENGIYDYRYEDFFHGLYPNDIDGDETINQAKDRIIKILDENGIKVTREDIRWYEDGGYDG